MIRIEKNKHLVLAILSLILLSSFNCKFKKKSGAARIIQVENPGNNNDIQPYLQAAVDKAFSGDMVKIPEGSFILNKTVEITRFVSIVGAGKDKTLLYRPETVTDSVLTNDWNVMFLFDCNSILSSKIKVSGIAFKSKMPYSLKEKNMGSLATDQGIKMKDCVDFIITDCKFENFGQAAVAVNHNDEVVRGLICKNEFIHNYKGPKGQGLGYGVVVYGHNRLWTKQAQFGSANFIFVEDNTFDGHRHAIAGGGCARYVFRFNKVNNNNIGVGSSHAVDAHEARQVKGTNYYSTRAIEVYNNEIINTTFMNGKKITAGQKGDMLVENAIMIRGGEALIHDNIIKGFRFGIGIVNFEVDGPQNYPIFTQIGYASALKYGKNHSGLEEQKGDGDLFVWNNVFTPYYSEDSSSMFYNYRPEYFLENRDYHLSACPDYKTYEYPHPMQNL